MLINKKSALISAASSTDLDIQFNLQNVMIKDGIMYASNGHSLYWAKTSIIEEDEYPEIKQSTHQEKILFIPASSIKKSLKNMAGVKSGILDVLKNYLHVFVSKKNIELTTTNLDVSETIKIKNNSENYNFPNVDALIKKEPEATKENSFSLSIVELSKLCGIMKKSDVQIVRFKNTGAGMIFVSDWSADKEDIEIKALLMTVNDN